MSTRRIERINSLLKEVISEVIRQDLKNHTLATDLISVTEVDTSKDLRYAKVYISLIESDPVKRESVIEALQKSAGLIAVLSSKKVILRYFPSLTFKLDNSLDKYMHIDSLLKKIGKNESS